MFQARIMSQTPPIILTLLLLINIYPSHTKTSVVYMPFKVSCLPYAEEAVNFLSCFQTQLTTDFEVGTPKRKVNAVVTFDDSDFSFVLENECVSADYNRFESSSFINITNWDRRFSEDYCPCEAVESFYFYTDKKCEVNQLFENVPFIMSTYLNKKFCPKIGLKLSRSLTDSGKGIIGALKRTNIISGYSWTLEFTSSTEGYLILGGEPHKYNDNYNENNLRFTTNYIDKEEQEYVWQLPFDNIYLGNDKQLNNYFYARINPKYSNIKGTFEFFQEILSSYFQNYINKGACQRETFDVYNKKSHYFYCLKTKFGKKDIRKFPSLKFFNKAFNYTFEFKGDELFEEKEGKYFFKIITEIGSSKGWEFGVLFLQKYQLIFNSDSKLIGYYIKEHNATFSSFFNDIIKVLLILILLGVLGYLGFFSYRKYKKENKRRLANELVDEDFVYNKAIVNDGGDNGVSTEMIGRNESIN